MRCESCKVDSESDAKYCRKCGTLLNPSPQHSSEEPSAEHNAPAEAVKSNSTSVIGVDFSNPPSPKQVEPLRKEGSSKAAKNHRRWRRLRATLWPATAIALQLAIAVTTITYVRRNTLPPQQAQAPTPAEEAAFYATDKAIKEREQELVDKTRTSEEFTKKLAAQENEIAKRQQLIEELDEESADKRRELKKLEKRLVAAKAKLNEVKTETVGTERRRDQLNREIARDERRLKASRKAVAQLASKRSEVAQLDRRLKVLRTKVSQNELVVRNLQKRIDLMTNANHASGNRRTPRKR